MKFVSSYTCAAFVATSACSTVTYETAPQPSCVGGSVRTAAGECVITTKNLDELGLPTTITVTNFAPAILPVIAVVGAVAAASAARGAGDGGDTNGTNGTN